MSLGNKEHRKHVKLARPETGTWGRNELALLGASCREIRTFAESLAARLSPHWKLAFADMEHSSEETGGESALHVHCINRKGDVQLRIGQQLQSKMQHSLFNQADLVLVNGNHFSAARQVVFVREDKPLKATAGQLGDVCLVLLEERNTAIPEELKRLAAEASVVSLDDMAAIAGFFDHYLKQRIAPLNGLVLAGGQSLRMGTDKSLLEYHGKTQRELVFDLLQPFCKEVYVSCNSRQSPGIVLPKIEDLFIDLGPMAGILSAFRTNPNAAWLTVACDLPFLTEKTLSYLVSHRNPSAIATAFLNEESGFPEPMITIWEPRAYPVLMQALAEGHSCPRKVLINSDVSILKATYPQELRNINDPSSYELAAAQLATPAQNKLP